MTMWCGEAMGAWEYALTAIGTILFFALVIVGIAALVRYLGRGAPPPRDSREVPPIDRPGPEGLLAGRFARGEIDEDDYRSRLATLRAPRGESSG